MINLEKWKHEIPDDCIAIEINGTKKTIQKQYDDGWFLCWTPERIKSAFNSGNGTIKDLKRYQKNNTQYCTFIFLKEVY